MNIVFDESAWEDYEYWLAQDRRVLKRINALLKDIVRQSAGGRPNEGIGKPEALKYGLQGYWSRRISDEHRLVYKVVGEDLRIAACRHHYE